MAQGGEIPLVVKRQDVRLLWVVHARLKFGVRVAPDSERFPANQKPTCTASCGSGGRPDSAKEISSS